MRRAIVCLLILALATVAHIDWHVARPTHHRLSLGWPYHWILGVVAFAIVGWIVARRFPEAPARAAAIVVIGALAVAQGLEPLLEVAFYEHRLGYPIEPGRWAALGVFVAAGLPAMILALQLCKPRRRKQWTTMTHPSATS